MEFNNPFKDLDKKKFKESTSQNSLEKNSNTKGTVNSKNTEKYPNKTNNYNSYHKKTNNPPNSILDNNSNILTKKTELSDEELFLQSMQSTLKTEFIDNEKDKYFVKNQDDTNHKKNKNKDKKTANSIENAFKEKNFAAENLPKTKEEKLHNSFSSLSNIIDKKLSLKDENLVLNQDISKKAAFIKNAEKPEKAKNETINNEENDFILAMQGVKPINNENIHIPEVEKIVIQNDPKPLMFDFEEGKIEFSLTSNDEHVQCNILGLDLHILAQLQNRHYNPESHIDLHGFNARQAFDALIPFFKNAYYKDMRSLLIVTGKGLNSFDGKPFLRSKVCDWLIQNPFKHLVIAFCTAKPQDGGSGALYVLLRKRKKNAKEINWDKLPNDYDLWAHLDK